MNARIPIQAFPATYGIYVPPEPEDFDFEWETRTTSAGWSPRDGAMLVHFLDKWWLLGGWNPTDVSFPAHPLPTTNEIWSSLDLETWTLELAHSANPPTSGAGARWKRRHWFGCFKHTHDNVEYVYVIGGDHFCNGDNDFSGSGGYQCDVWRSSDMLTWERVCASDAPTWKTRMLSVAGSSPGKLWVFGGQNGLLAEVAGSVMIYNDLHVSEDGGETWTVAVPNLPGGSATQPTGRGIQSKLAYWQGRLWLVSGGTYDTAANANRQYFREVWSIDPENTALGWTKHAILPGPGAEYSSIEVYRNRLWLIAGYSGDGYGGGTSGQNIRYIWSSGDGERWQREETPPWLETHAAGCAVSSDGTLLGFVAGNGDILSDLSHASALLSSAAAIVNVPVARGIWKMSDAVLDGANVVSVPDSSGSGAPDLVFGNALGDATFNESDADFGGEASAESNGGHFLRTESVIDLSDFTIFIVGKFARTAGSFYAFYALTTGPVQYAYDFMGPSASAVGDRIDRNFDFRRNGVSTAGSVISTFDNDAIRNIYVAHFDGTAAGSELRLEGARVVPDAVANTGDAGTSAWSAILHILSDNGGTGSKAGKVAEVRVYPKLTAAQRRAVDRELSAAYPYSFAALAA